ncbi:MAG: TonB-dependent receptor [Robiginitomaculum sp.]|nr:TonB-dependent receptor [Robiginitomaculum sp.]
MKFNFLSLAIIPASLFSTLVFANEVEELEEQIVVIGSRMPIPVSQITSTVTIIDEEELLARGDEFVADALRRVPSLAVNRSGPAGGLTQVRVRGSEANQVLVFIDGMEASDPFSGSFGFSSAISAGITKIEVMRGEQSALWGTDAIGGVINILTEPVKQGDQLKVKMEAGSLDSYSGSIYVSSVKDERKIWLQASGLQTAGYDVSGNSGERDGFNQRQVFAGLNLPLNQNWTAQFRARTQNAKSDFDSDTDFDGRLNDTDSQLDNDLSMARLAIKGESFDGGWLSEIYASSLSSRTISGNSTSTGTRTRVGGQTSVVWESGKVSHRLTGVLEGRFETYQNHAGAGALQNQQQQANSYAIAGDYLANSGPLTVSLSARHEFNDLFDDTNALRAGLAWNFEELNGKFLGSAGQGIKNPGFFELYGFFPAFFVGNPNLQAETSTGYELGWQQSFAKGTASITLFTAELNNEIYTDFGVFPATARNRTSASTRQGVELSGELQLTSSIFASGSMSFLSAKENNIPEIRRPEFLASLSVFWRDASENWQLSLGVDHNGSMRDTDFGSFQPVTLAAYTLIRAKASRKVGDNFSIYLRGENLGNANYQEVFGYASQGRALYGGLAAQF